MNRRLQVAGTQHHQGKPNSQLRSSPKQRIGEHAANGVCPDMDPLKRGQHRQQPQQELTAVNGDIPSVVTPDRVGGEGTVRGSRAVEAKASAQHGVVRASSGGVGKGEHPGRSGTCDAF